MFLPLGDSPNPRGVPIATYALIAVNVAVFVAITLPLSSQAPDLRDPMVFDYIRVVAEQAGRPVPAEEILRGLTSYDLFVFRHGFQPGSPSLADLFFAIFLHGGFMHLFGNMLFLWIYGDNVEHRLGSVAYVVAYLATGVAATLFHAVFDAGSMLPMVGASGAISGVLGFYFVWFPRNQVRLFVALFPFFMDVVTVPARMLLLFYLFLENVLPFLVTRGLGGGGVAYGAHIGGFVAGWAIARWMDRRVEVVPPAEYRAARATARDRVGREEEIRDQISADRFSDAVDRYFGLPSDSTRGLLAPRDSLKFGAWLAVTGHPEAAAVVYRRLLRDHPRGLEAAEAHLALGEILLQRLRQPTAAYQHLLDALDLDPPPGVAERASLLLDQIAGLQKMRLRGR